MGSIGNINLVKYVFSSIWKVSHPKIILRETVLTFFQEFLNSKSYSYNSEIIGRWEWILDDTEIISIEYMTF